MMISFTLILFYDNQSTNNIEYKNTLYLHHAEWKNILLTQRIYDFDSIYAW